MWSGAHLEARALQPPPPHTWTPAAPACHADWIQVQANVRRDDEHGSLGWGTRERQQQVPPLQPLLLLLLLPQWILR